MVHISNGSQRILGATLGRVCFQCSLSSPDAQLEAVLAPFFFNMLASPLTTLLVTFPLHTFALLSRSPLPSQRLSPPALAVVHPRVSTYLVTDAQGQRSPYARHATTNATLPVLSLGEQRQLTYYGSLERQRRAGRVGEALVAIDSMLAADAVWAKLCDVAAWSHLMRGVRSSVVREQRRGAVRAAFQVTKLRLPANIVLELPGGLDASGSGTIPFYLDKSVANIAVDSLQGFWHVEPSPNDQYVTRVWLCASVGACAIVPNGAVDYVASKALRRATAWLRDEPSEA